MSLEPAEMNAASYLLQHVAGVLHRQADQVLQERLGIGLSQFRILMMVPLQPTGTQRTLADALGQTEASVSRQVKLLQEKGFLASRIDPQERRRHLTVATAKGLKMTEAARDVLAEFHAPLFQSLGVKHSRHLQTILATLHDTLCMPGRSGSCDHPFDGEPL